MSKQLSDVDRALISQDLQYGFSQRFLSEKYKVSKTAIQKIFFKCQNNETLTRKFGSGRPSKITDTVKGSIMNYYDSNHFVTLKEISNRLLDDIRIKVSESTISRFLNSQDLETRRPAYKPLLRPQNIIKRKKFAKEYLGISNEDLNRIIFSDECKFELYQSDNHRYVRYRKGERYNMVNIVPSIKHGGGSVMVWGCISSKGAGRLVFIDGIMTAAYYKQILSQNLLQTANEMDLESFIFMHDNDPKHTARLIQEWTDEKNIEMLNWPPQSPDLNPIEHIWAYIKVQLKGLGLMGKDETKAEILRVWNELTPEFVQKYI